MLKYRSANRNRFLLTMSANLTLAALVSACGSKKENSSGKPAPKPDTSDATKQGANPNADASSPAGAFLKWSDFDSYVLPKEQKTASDSVVRALTWESTFYANFPEWKEDLASDLTPQERAQVLTEQKCRDEVIQKGASVEIDNDIVKVTFKFTDTCNKSESKTTEGVFRIQCVGSDLSGLKGKTMKELVKILSAAKRPDGVCGKSSEYRSLMNGKSETEVRYNFSQRVSAYDSSGTPDLQSSAVTTQVVDRSTGIGARMQPNGAPCIEKRKGNTFVLEGECWTQDADRTTTDYAPESGRDSETRVTRNLFKSKGVIEDIGSNAVWLRAGTFDVTVNEWKGTVTASPAGAPRAVLTSPSGEKIDQLIPVARYDYPAAKQSAPENNGSSSTSQSDSYNSSLESN